MTAPARNDGLAKLLRRLVDNRAYRLTVFSLVFIVAAILLIPWEVIAVVKGYEGGPLTHIVKWAYGEPLSQRWWLLGWGNSGFLLWLPPHFLFGEMFGFKTLCVFVAAGFLLGLAGYHLTH